MVNWIIVRKILYIASIHALSGRLMEFVLAFSLYDLDVDFLMEIHLVMGVDVNRVQLVLKLNKSLYGLKQESKNGLILYNLI